MTDRKLMKLRTMIVAKKGYTLVMCDLSQAESWIVAYLANDPNMKYALQFGDLHLETAGSAIFFPGNCTSNDYKHSWNKDTRICNNCLRVVSKDMRYVGKKTNHATGYGMEEYRFVEVVNAESDLPPFVTINIQQARQYQKGWHDYYPTVREWHRDIQRQLTENNRVIVTPYNRSRTFYGHWGNELFKKAYANIPQSTIADHFNGRVHPALGIHGGLIEVYKRVTNSGKNDIRLTNQSHDSCILEVPENTVDEVAAHTMSLIKRPLVVNGEQFTIPVDCEVGDRWGEMEKWIAKTS